MNHLKLNSMKQNTPKKKYWYKIYITECVLCGVGKKTKERVYVKPKPEEKVEFTQFACSMHFV